MAELSQTSKKFDMEAWKFFVQVAFSGVVLGLCIVQLIAKPSNDPNTALYWGGVTSVLAYWLPSPGQSKEEKDKATAAVIPLGNTNGHRKDSDSQIAVVASAVSQSGAE